MKSQDIQKHIDRVVGTDGTLRTPAWWMHKILTDLVRYCEGLDDSEAINALKEKVENKQDIIADLAKIRAGAEMGATALQSIPSVPTKTSELTNDSGFITMEELNNAITTILNTEV